MILKKWKPVTPSSRNLIQVKNLNLAKKPLLKQKIIGLKTNTGRNKYGRITVRHKGGGHKQNYREINFFRNIDGIFIVLSLEYDPNRSATIASIYNILTKEYEYIIAPKNIQVGDVVKSGKNAEVKNGHALPLAKIPVGSIIHCVSIKPFDKAIISRAAGSFCELIEKRTLTVGIKCRSNKYRYISKECVASIGSVSNELLFLTNIGKAGRSRWLNKRPKVRGVAMNPIDHPHGGGEGKTSGGRTSVTPWGKPSKNKKTSRSNF